jgi:glutathione S-transferase
MKARMTPTKLIHLHTSPFSERVRWALDLKGVVYEKANYAVSTGEEDLITLTGQRQVPVLVAGDEVIPDSTAILEWLEQHVPNPPLVPTNPRDHAQVMLYEELACAVLAPEGRQMLIARLLKSEDELPHRFGRFLAKKYAHSEFALARARAAVRRGARGRCDRGRRRGAQIAVRSGSDLRTSGASTPGCTRRCRRARGARP